MNAVLARVFGSPRTTLAGVLAIVVSALGSAIIPQVVVFLGSQPSLGWQLLGMALGLIAPALMKDKPEPPPPQLVP